MEGFRSNVFDTLKDKKLTIPGTKEREIEDQIDFSIENIQLSNKKIILTVKENIHPEDSRSDISIKIKDAVRLYA